MCRRAQRAASVYTVSARVQSTVAANAMMDMPFRLTIPAGWDTVGHPYGGLPGAYRAIP
ncbi:hypothetical protein ETAR_08520 [Edwardsiella tarda]|nr:hypothetical protein GBS0709_08440 [Edwardsiella tarda]GAC63953.1 hypothetical protein ET1_08_00260 [Edwardsiella tarda ATCC 15947 = NBRC 105688]